MCLTKSESHSDYILKRAKWKSKTFYKVLVPVPKQKLDSNGNYKLYKDLQGPFYNLNNIGRPLWTRAGWQVSNRLMPLWENDLCAVKHGIHVCNSLREAKRFKAHLEGVPHATIVKVTCYRKDFVATNYSKTQSVFRKVYLSKQEKDRVLKS
jgi:hypothetical protein